MPKTKTVPKFLAAGAAGDAEELRPYAAYKTQANELRKQIATAPPGMRRDALIREHSALLAKQARLYPLGPVVPLSFAQRLALRRFEEELPNLLDVLSATVSAILSPDSSGDKPALLRQAFAEFTAAIQPELAPSATN